MLDRYNINSGLNVIDIYEFCKIYFSNGVVL